MRNVCYKVVAQYFHRVEFLCHEIEIVNGVLQFLDIPLIGNLYFEIPFCNFLGTLTQFGKRQKE